MLEYVHVIAFFVYQFKNVSVNKQDVFGKKAYIATQGNVHSSIKKTLQNDLHQIK